MPIPINTWTGDTYAVRLCGAPGLQMVVDCCVWLTLYTQSQFTDNLKKEHNHDPVRLPAFRKMSLLHGIRPNQILKANTAIPIPSLFAERCKRTH